MSLGGHDLPSPPPSPSHDPLQDVFNEHIDSGNKDSSIHPSSTVKVQRVHFDNGYRDGITNAKGTHVQDGFDEGYPLGAELALRVGVILGAFDELNATVEGYIQLMKSESEKNSSTGGPLELNSGEKRAEWSAPTQARFEEWTACSEELQVLRRACQEELTLQSIFGTEHFNGEGLWRWDAEHPIASTGAAPCSIRGTRQGEDENGEDGREIPQITFREVADAHPLIVKWRAIAATSMQKYSLNSDELAWFDGSAHSADDGRQNDMQTQIDAGAGS